MDEQTCPFCLTNDNLIVDGDYEVGYWVHCCNCSSTGPMAEESEEAYILWASRSDEILNFKARAVKLLPI